MLDSGEVGKNIISGAYMRSSVHIENQKNYILTLGKGPTQRLDDTTLTAEAKYSISFSEKGKKFCLNIDYKGSKNNQFEEKYFELNANPLC